MIVRFSAVILPFAPIRGRGPSLRVNTPALVLPANLVAVAVEWGGDEAWGLVSRRSYIQWSG